MKLFFRDFGTAGKPPLVVMHGLLGSSRNWQMVGRDLAAHFHVRAIDLPNHGSSPHAEQVGFSFMEEQVLGWLREQGLGRVTLMGHSMGGKLAMLIACRHPELIERLIIVDIAPKDYFSMSHRSEFAAMNELHLETLRSRAEAELRFEARVPDWGMRKFLVTNLESDEQGRWRWMVNLKGLTEGLRELECDPLLDTDRFQGKALFILGGKSRYVNAGDRPLIEKHFPTARLELIPEAGHNPHMETREAFVKLVAE